MPRVGAGEAVGNAEAAFVGVPVGAEEAVTVGAEDGAAEGSTGIVSIAEGLGVIRPCSDGELLPLPGPHESMNQLHKKLQIAISNVSS